MSWFSLIQAERNVLDSQSFFDSVLTGQFIGKYAVDCFFNQTQTYVKIKRTVALFFSNHCFPEMHPISAKISEKLMERIKQEKSSSKLFPQIVKSAMANALEPFCRKVVKKGMNIFVQKQIETALDTISEKGISLAVITGIYYVAKTALSSSFLSVGSYAKPSINFAYEYLPSPGGLLATLTTFHTLEMVYIIWKTSFFEDNKLHDKCDKEEVKQLIIDQVKEPIKETLKGKRAYRVLRLILNEKKVDGLISFLINELIDHFYWEKIHQIRFLSLPLVS